MARVLDAPQSRLELLIEANLADVYRAFAVSERWQTLVRPVFYKAARQLAKRMLVFDEQIAQLGLQMAARQLLSYYCSEVSVEGSAFVAQGKLLIAVNHPGLTDILVLLSQLSRDDVRIIAAERRLLRALPNLSKHLIFLSATSLLRMSTIKEVKKHLDGKGCLILFPKGAIEADPLISAADAIQTVDGWLPSLKTFATLSGPLSLQAAIVKGVRHPGSFKHPLLYLRRDPKERDWLAATLQLLLKRYQVQPELHISAPYTDIQDLCKEAKRLMVSGIRP